MTKNKKIHKLVVEFDKDFVLIALASHENDYRLSWAMNKKLGFGLSKSENLSFMHPKQKTEASFSLYQFVDDSDIIFHLISNKSEGGFLIPELKNIDYILKVENHPSQLYIEKLITGLKSIDIVITAFEIKELSEKNHKLFLF